jgi:hypothetical protein
MRKVSLTFGLSFITLGLILVAVPEFRAGEKPDAIFFLGHWFDIVWELGAPCLSLGAVLCIVSALSRRRSA